MADLFPLLLSIVTLGILLLQCVIFISGLIPAAGLLTRYLYTLPSCHRIVLDLTSRNAFTARPAFEIPLLGTLTIVWLGEHAIICFPIRGPRSYRVHATPNTHNTASNSFSTSRYMNLPNCSIFPDGMFRGRCSKPTSVRSLNILFARVR